MADTQPAPASDVADAPPSGSIREAQQALMGLLDSEEQPEQQEAAPVEDSESTDVDPDEESEAVSEEAEAEELIEDDPEEDTDDEEPEAELEGDDSEADVVYEVKVGDETLEVDIDELIKGYSRQSDYTKKTQAISEQQKAFDTLAQQHQAEIQQIQQERQQYMDSLTSVIENAGLDKMNIDWERLKAEDPLEYITKREEFRENQEKIQRLQQEQQVVAEKQKAEHEKMLTAALAQEHEQLVEKLPEWGKPDTQQKLAGELRSYLVDSGYQIEEIDQLIDHRSFLVAHKAMLYDRLKKADPKAKKLKNKPKVVRGGKGTTRTREARERVSANRNRLKQTGHVRDAARALEDIFS